MVLPDRGNFFHLVDSFGHSYVLKRDQIKMTKNLAKRRVAAWCLKILRKQEYLRVLLLLPASIMVLVILIVPFFYSFYLSFQSLNLLRSGQLFAGIANYIQLFRAELFATSFTHSLIFTGGSVLGEYILGLVSALLLYQRIRGMTLWRALTLLPWIVPIIVSTLTWKWMLTPRYGIINTLAVRLGFVSFSRFWLGDPAVVMPTVILINIWRSFPFYTIVILAALQMIPLEIFEACDVDGVSRFQRFRHIMLPHIKTISLTVIILHIILTYDHFDTIWFLTKGGPADFTEVLPTYLYRTAFQNYDIGVSSAIAVVTVVTVLLIAGTFFFATKEHE